MTFIFVGMNFSCPIAGVVMLTNIQTDFEKKTEVNNIN